MIVVLVFFSQEEKIKIIVNRVKNSFFIFMFVFDYTLFNLYIISSVYIYVFAHLNVKSFNLN